MDARIHTTVTACVDDFAALADYPGRPEREPDMAALPVFPAQMQAHGLGLAIQVQSDGRPGNVLAQVITRLAQSSATGTITAP